MRRTWLPAIAITSAALAGWVVSACDDGSIELPECPMIPEGGCPLESGGSCVDVLCAAVYECVGESWQLVQTCEGSGGGGAGGSSSSGGGSSGEGGCAGAVIDKTDEAVGCQPDLQRPDCPAVAAEGCQPCQTGCVDFFLCKSDGWHAVAYCDGDGQLIVEP